MSRTLTQEEQPTLHRLFRKAAEEFTEHVAIIYDGGNTKDHMVYGTLLTKATVVSSLYYVLLSELHDVDNLVLITINSSSGQTIKLVVRPSSGDHTKLRYVNFGTHAWIHYCA